MKYFTEDLEVVEAEVKQLQELCKNQPDNVNELAKDFTQELLEVNRYLTVEKYLKFKSSFYQQKFKDRIISDVENNVVAKYGISMNEETFNNYLNQYNERYELQ